MVSFFSYWHHAIGNKWGPPRFLLNQSLLEYVEFGALELVSIISSSSILEIMHPLFCWIPYSSMNILSNFQIFSHPAQPVGNRFNRIIVPACVEH